MTLRAAVVTGAAAGLGAGIVRRLARDGWAVVGVDRNPSIDAVMARLGTEVGALSDRLIPLVGDVTEPSTAEEAVARAVEAFGSLNLAVANAGIGGRSNSVVELDPAEFDWILAVNLRGVFLTCQAAARQMLVAGRGGSIVTVSSCVAHHPEVTGAAYGASKAGVIAFTRTLALELAPSGIRVNSVSPGAMATEMHWDVLAFRAQQDGLSLEEERLKLAERIPLRRHGTADDAAGAVAFLASDDARYVTGTTLDVDGGLLLL